MRLYCNGEKLIKKAITFIAICSSGFVRIKSSDRQFHQYELGLSFSFYLWLLCTITIYIRSIMKKTIFVGSEKQGAVRLNFIFTQSAQHLKNNQAAHLNSEICPNNNSRRINGCLLHIQIQTRGSW